MNTWPQKGPMEPMCAVLTGPAIFERLVR